MGPKKFEKEFEKRMQGLFNETKVFFFHKGSQTKIAYADNGKLLYVEVFRADYELDHWCNYFLEYLKTGVFDNNAYWRVYGNGAARGHENWLSEITPVEMQCVKQIWSVYSPAFHKFMEDVRAEPGKSGVGFKRRPKPIEE